MMMSSQFAKGSVENLRSDLTTKTGLTGHYECHETLIANCGTASASFAYLVVALGATLFAVYAIRLRRRTPSLPEELKHENVMVDKEGWETKASEGKGRKQSKTSNDEERKKKSDGWVPGP